MIKIMKEAQRGKTPHPSSPHDRFRIRFQGVAIYFDVGALRLGTLQTRICLPRWCVRLQETPITCIPTSTSCLILRGLGQADLTPFTQVLHTLFLLEGLVLPFYKRVTG